MLLAPSAPAVPHRPGWFLPSLAMLFFLSGACALVYQVLWLRLLSHVFGVTVWAACAVLAVYMAGLALGGYLSGHLADRVRAPARWFGLVEILVGLTALASQPALILAEQVYVWWAATLPDAVWALTFARLLLSSLVLIVPTTLMGATLPLIVRSAVTHSADLGRHVSTLYALNTFGAIAGTLLAGYVLIGEIGIAASFRLAASVNLIIGMLALLTGWRIETPAPTHDEATASLRSEANQPDLWVSPTFRRCVLLTFGISGLVSLALEVVWFRALMLFLESTTYAFTIMLATVLAGIAAGSATIVPVIMRRWPWPMLLTVVELLIGVSAVLSMSLLAVTPALLHWITVFTGNDSELIGRLAAPLVSFAALFPTTFLFGVAFPLGLRLWAARDAEQGALGQSVGVFYSLNVAGAIAGPILAGFLALPVLGIQGSVIAFAALPLLAGLALLRAQRGGSRNIALGGLFSVAFLAASITMPHPAQAVVTSRYPGERLLWHQDGDQMSVTIHETADGLKRMYLDGVPQASDDRATLAVHRHIGGLPLALHPDPRRALVIGLGGGVSPGLMSRYPGLELDIVELSSVVPRAALWYREVNEDVVNQPNVDIRIDDGRNFMLLTSNRYDIITADAIRPYNAGSGNLYSREYFTLARDVLTDDGLMVQWVAGVSNEHQRAIVATFMSVFPEVTYWDRRLLVGGKQPLRLSERVIEGKLSDPQSRAVLNDTRIRSFKDLLEMYRAGPAELKPYAESGVILSDDRPVTEYFLSLPTGRARASLERLQGNPRSIVIQDE